jgi:hypothetical protein
MEFDWSNGYHRFWMIAFIKKQTQPAKIAGCVVKGLFILQIDSHALP